MRRRLLLACALLLLVGSLTRAQAEPRVFVLEQSTGLVRQYSLSGADLGVFAAGLTLPAALTADDAGNIYVSNYGRSEVRKFSPEGVELLTIPLPFQPAGVRVGSDGTIYVANYFGHAVHRYSASGADLGLFVSIPPFARADFIIFDADGYLYVTDFMSSAVRRISPAGGDLGTLVTVGGAEGIAFDSNGNLYVSSYSGGTITKFSAAGAQLGTFVSAGLAQPYGLAFDNDGNLYVADYAAGAIRRFSPTGSDLGIVASGLGAPRDLVIVDSVVSYACVGFQPPFDESLTLKGQVNRVIPLKLQLIDDGGIPTTDVDIAGPPPRVKVEFSPDGGPAADVTGELPPGGDIFRFEPTIQGWILNLGTRPFGAAGTYTVLVEAGDATYATDPGCAGEFVRLP